jgi:hypothetical protein|tara:strand:+ start:1796 stop:2161 length:366 start_codon:yes stop_codon:yes gene_type:complete
MPEAAEWKSQIVTLDSTTTSDTVTEVLIAAVTDKRIEVKAVHLSIDDAGVTAFAFLDGSGGAALTGSYDLEDTTEFILPPVPADGMCKWMKTAKGGALWITYDNGGTAADIMGTILYTEVF